MLQRTDKTTIFGGRVVTPGDTVNLAPCSKEEHQFMINWLGEPPYTILWIGKWGSGSTILYIKTEDPSGTGVHPSYFV